MPAPFESAFLAFARQATRPAVLAVWFIILVVSNLIAGLSHPSARWWLLASTGATIVTFCLYIAFLRRSRRAGAERARAAAFDRMLTEVELRPSPRSRIRQVTLNGDLCDD